MKHASPATLAQLAPLLIRVRGGLPGLREPRPGTFYERSQAFLHFHEDPTGLYADAKLERGGEFTRFPVNTPREQDALIAALVDAIERAAKMSI